MRTLTYVATVLLAALPIVANAGIASERALQVNQETASASAARSEQVAPDAVADYRYTGNSSAMTEARLNLITKGEPLTRFPENPSEEQPGRQATGNS